MFKRKSATIAINDLKPMIENYVDAYADHDVNEPHVKDFDVDDMNYHELKELMINKIMEIHSSNGKETPEEYASRTIAACVYLAMNNFVLEYKLSGN